MSTLKKKATQITNKLEEYVKAYPDYKPDKKSKKNIDPPAPQNKKSNSKTAKPVPAPEP